MGLDQAADRSRITDLAERIDYVLIVHVIQLLAKRPAQYVDISGRRTGRSRDYVQVEVVPDRHGPQPESVHREYILRYREVPVVS
jgi:hypothetical protein